MNFETLDINMRRFETSLDQVILPDLYLVVRIDGRNFTRLTKEICEFEAPFDTRFRDAMTDTVKHLMECGFRIVYGYTQSDEISLLFHPDDRTFGRKTRKINSVLAGEASAFFCRARERSMSFNSFWQRFSEGCDAIRWTQKPSMAQRICMDSLMDSLLSWRILKPRLGMIVI